MKQKYLVIVKAVREQHLTVAQVAKRYSVSRQWVYQLLARYDTEGPDGLEVKSRAPINRPGKTSEPVRARIVELRRELAGNGADAGPETIAWHLRNEGLHTPAISTIRRILHQAGLITPEPKKRPRISFVRFEGDLPNECWQADITYWFLQDGTRVEILDFLDDHSRFLLSISAQDRFTGANVVTTMTDLIGEYGPPASTLTDNALVFTTRFSTHPGAKGGFEKLLTLHSIQQKNGSPGHPQTQGKIERFHQILKRWLAARPLPTDIAELNVWLAEFRTWYNSKRPHRAVSKRTPNRHTPP